MLYPMSFPLQFRPASTPVLHKKDSREGYIFTGFSLVLQAQALSDRILILIARIFKIILIYHLEA